MAKTSMCQNYSIAQLGQTPDKSTNSKIKAEEKVKQKIVQSESLIGEMLSN